MWANKLIIFDAPLKITVFLFKYYPNYQNYLVLCDDYKCTAK